jgi:hypothetical protein
MFNQIFISVTITKQIKSELKSIPEKYNLIFLPRSNGNAQFNYDLINNVMALHLSHRSNYAEFYLLKLSAVHPGEITDISEEHIALIFRIEK